jgi:hypothetical protein
MAAKEENWAIEEVARRVEANSLLSGAGRWNRENFALTEF